MTRTLVGNNKIVELVFNCHVEKTNVKIKSKFGT